MKRRLNNEIIAIANNHRLDQGQLVVDENEFLMKGVPEGRRTEDEGALAIVRNLFERHVDVFHYFLYHTDMATLLNFRCASKEICKQSMRFIKNLSPLMHKVYIPFAFNQLMADPVKLEFAQKNTAIRIRKIDISHLKDPALLYDNIFFKEALLSLAFQINRDEELKELSELLFSNELSEKQQSILEQIKELSFAQLDAEEDEPLGVDVLASGIASINTILKYFGATARSCQLNKLSFGAISTPFSLIMLPNLKQLSIGDVDAELTLPDLENLMTLSFSNINIKFTLQEMQKLTKLSFGDIDDDLDLPELNNLISLAFSNINVPLTLPNFSSLTTLEFGDINAALKLLALPCLISLKFADIYTKLILSGMPNLMTLEFGNINAKVTLHSFATLKSLSFGNINCVIGIPMLENLTNLTFGDINAVTKLTSFPNLERNNYNVGTIRSQILT